MALSNDRMKSMERWTYKQFTLASGSIAYKNGIAVINLATGKVVPGAAGPGYFVIGTFAEQVDASAADKLVNVNLGTEIEVEWFANSSGTALAATDVGGLAYVEDDQTVSGFVSGRSIAGRVWAYSATKGVAVQKLSSAPAGLSVGTLAAFSAANINVPASPSSDVVYDVPPTAANSTITLPATARQGTRLMFRADGTKNGHTVTYRDATGPTSLTTALTASKIHLVTAVFLGTTWACNAYIAP